MTAGLFIFAWVLGTSAIVFTSIASYIIVDFWRFLFHLTEEDASSYLVGFIVTFIICSFVVPVIIGLQILKVI